MCTSLTGRRGTVTALRDIELSLEPGRVLSLLGPNGAGKTTLLVTLAGLLPAALGSIVVDGAELPSGRPSASNVAEIVLVPDNRSLFTSLTVAENLRAAARKGGRAPKGDARRVSRARGAMEHSGGRPLGG